MFCCVFESYFGVGETCVQAYHRMVESIEFEGSDWGGEPDVCEFYVSVPVDITEKTEYHIEPDLDNI